MIDGYVFAVFQGFDDAGVGGGAADAELFQGLHQRGFVEAGRRLGEVLLAVEFVYRQGVAHGQFGQLFVVFVLVVFIVPFLIHAQEAGKYEHLAGGAEHAFAHADVYGGGVEFGFHHLAGHGALPNHLVELELVGGKEGLHAFGCAVYRSGTDGFVRLLGVFGFGAVHARRFGQEISTDFVVDVVADFGYRVLRQGYAVSTHISNQADRALADIHAFK